eukprot:TRINITY_DN10947_c0_g1_i1.p1 TRINITY_DN10947_c0_g1~~TRINITY_DN10947_c0_g1_i1.p1  ORF type:complete len:446 (-),score=68.12 TRINITY_DN10947_c0_g1_i1:50-1345(-)
MNSATAAPALAPATAAVVAPRQRCRSCGKNRPLDSFVGRKCRPTKQCRKCNLVADDMVISHLFVLDDIDATLRSFTIGELCKGIQFDSVDLFCLFKHKFLDQCYELSSFAPGPGVVIENIQVSFDQLAAQIARYIKPTSSSTSEEPHQVSSSVSNLCSFAFSCSLPKDCSGEVLVTVHSNGRTFLHLTKPHSSECQVAVEDNASKVERKPGRKRKIPAGSQFGVLVTSLAQESSGSDSSMTIPLQDPPVHWELISRFDEFLCSVQALPDGDLKSNTIEHMRTMMDLFVRESFMDYVQSEDRPPCSHPPEQEVIYHNAQYQPTHPPPNHAISVKREPQKSHSPLGDHHRLVRRRRFLEEPLDVNLPSQYKKSLPRSQTQQLATFDASSQRQDQSHPHFSYPPPPTSSEQMNFLPYPASEVYMQQPQQYQRKS